MKYGFEVHSSYVSLINPFFFNHYSYETYKQFCYSSPNEKIYIKQSYMILTWFYYLNFISKKKSLNSVNTVSMISLPTKIKKFTITKAPIAHKTNSKEQIQITFFYYKIIYKTFNLNFYDNYFFFKNCNSLLLFILLSKNTLSLSETNLLFLKNTTAFVTCIDPYFFKYRY